MMAAGRQNPLPCRLRSGDRASCYACDAGVNIPSESFSTISDSEQFMTSSQVWKSVFNNWPTGVPRRGIVISTLNEPMPFKGFMVKEDVVLLDRTNPDSLGARFILVSFEAINCVKLIDPLKEAVFASAGFLGKFAKE
jgi:hypothetical protein